MFFFCCSGHGNFGSVLKGEYTKSDGEKIPVAVKKLKSEEMNNPKVHLRCTCYVLQSYHQEFFSVLCCLQYEHVGDIIALTLTNHLKKQRVFCKII